MAFKAAPLPHEWMIVSIIGFFVSILQVYQMSMRWGVTFAFFFILMFIASVISMTYATTDDEHLEVLAIHEKRRRS